ncbi:MAG TPA: DUF2141 domain-containing protein [Polyangiaceae bacterium]|nr:DUF2141 domain-containing protein [Polyangiaceae bacterium]
MTRASPRSIGYLAGALFVAALGLVAPSASADRPATAVLTMRLSLKNNSGQVGCLLFNAANGFPKDPSAALQRQWCPIASSGSICSFDPIPSGRYAVACFHDENSNGKLDTGLFGIPTEGTVASNHAKGFLGPPSFDDASFSFSGAPTDLRLKMSY